MGLTLVAEVVAKNSKWSYAAATHHDRCSSPPNTMTGAKADVTGADDLLSRFGLNRVYSMATSAPPLNPYAKLKQSIDRRLYKWVAGRKIPYHAWQYHAVYGWVTNPCMAKPVCTDNHPCSESSCMAVPCMDNKPLHGDAAWIRRYRMDQRAPAMDREHCYLAALSV